MQPNRTPKPIRNLDDKLVCRIDEPSGMVQIVKSTCITVIRWKPNGTMEVKHLRK